MDRRFMPIVIVLVLSAVGTAQTPVIAAAQQPLVVHEWGTFTSVAGPGGRAVEWLPLSGPPDLPCFTERVRFNVKFSLVGRIRMETPVLYFYAPRETTVNVRVRFQQGVVTEWFPHASVTPTIVDDSTLRDAAKAGTISWTNVRISPADTSTLPGDASRSHYYVARQTDASPLSVGSSHEKFLFYRGVGGFEPPISAAVAPDGRIVVANPGGGAIGDIILFENRGGTMAYQVRRTTDSRVTIDAPAPDGEFVAPARELEQMLIARGLYPKEAKAMVDTWRDSWFEEGTRLFYIAPPASIDAALSLDIHPVPSSLVRVFVGRIELITATTERQVAAAIDTNDRAALAKQGRFLQPVANSLMARQTPSERKRVEAALQPFYTALLPAPGVCR